MGIKQFRFIIIAVFFLCSSSISSAQTNSQERLPVMIHVLSDCSGRLFMPDDMIVPPRDLQLIDAIIKTAVCSKSGYGLSFDSFTPNLNQELAFKLKEKIEFYAAGSRYFPVIKYSTLRTGGVSSILEPPMKNYLRLSYRANYKRDKEPTIGEHLEHLEKSIKESYSQEIDYYGLNVLAELEYYISNALEKTDYKHVFIVFTDGFVNSSDQLIWSPKKIERAVENGKFEEALYKVPSSLNAKGARLILLETGGYDYNPDIGRTGKISQNDILKKLWEHWADYAQLDLVWRTKWDDVLSIGEIESLLYH